MAGDVNLFLDAEPDIEDCAEIDVMIGAKQHRRKGYAKEAVNLMVQFGKEKLGVKKFIAKIKRKNEASISLFKNQLGFVHLKDVKFECDGFSCDEVHFLLN